MRSIGTISILAIAVMRCATRFAPQVWFDADPAVFPGRLDGMGPAGSLWLDCLLLLAVALALLGEAISRRGIDWKLLVLALTPLPVVLWHGWDDGGNLWRGLTWAAAALAAAAIAHVARDRTWRAVIVGVLLAALVPMLLRGLLQVTIEHDALVHDFQSQREAFFAQRGWQPDSPEALIYERRLMQRQPLGWFATTNVFATFMALGVVACTGLLIASVRAKLPSGYAGGAAMLAAACAAALAFTGSKGAVLATVAGLLVLAPPLMIPAVRRFIDHHGGRVLVALIALALLGVIARGALLPEGFLNDKSLLFRWHYMQASAAIIADEPLVGVGPDHFQDAYTLHRPQRNPEEVQSAHSVFLDWLATLGVVGAAWVGMAMLLVWRCSPDRADELASSLPQATSANASSPWLLAAIIVVLALVPALWHELHTMIAQLAIVRVIGMLAFVLVAGMIAHVMLRADERPIRWILACAAITLLVHGQIEMTLTQPGAALWSFCLLGAAGIAAGGSAPSLPRRGTIFAIAAAIICAATSIVVFVRDALPAAKQQAIMGDAAEALAPIGRSRDDLDAVVEARRGASALLVQAYEAWPRNAQPLEAAAEQLARVVDAAGGGGGSYAAAFDAMELAEQAVAEHDRSTSWQLVSFYRERLADLADHDDERALHLDRAIAAAEQLTARDPRGVRAWVRLGDLRWKAGELDAARKAYERAIFNNANFELDPLKQFPQQELRRIESRIDAAASSNAQQS